MLGVMLALAVALLSRCEALPVTSAGSVNPLAGAGLSAGYTPLDSPVRAQHST